MKRLLLALFLVAVPVLGLHVWLPDDPHERIARSERFGKIVEHAKRIAPETREKLVGMVASLRTSGPQRDHIWESRRLAAIVKLENRLLNVPKAMQQSLDANSPTRKPNR